MTQCMHNSGEHAWFYLSGNELGAFRKYYAFVAVFHTASVTRMPQSTEQNTQLCICRGCGVEKLHFNLMTAKRRSSSSFFPPESSMRLLWSWVLFYINVCNVRPSFHPSIFNTRCVLSSGSRGVCDVTHQVTGNTRMFYEFLNNWKIRR